MAPMYAVGVTTVPAFARILPVNVAIPPVAIGEPVAGEKSNDETLVGGTPVAGNSAKSEAVVAVPSVKLLPLKSNEFCCAAVAAPGA